ncbi:endo alpha-1,4 polygalactosaminidase [Vibrio quintilis]|uniref:Glycoside-hydrolase family GH114 TIM-barrel domain-containing protein n=1 Tax=Vibrio quintilis TaxID=1117707 RepID=A0A1M7YV54_9VIBR|nr:endo alpha-1,4 polygalactosaminidase [Vibrio quintilis]SHO56539.1 hypothetical protein VQ7734_02308 [Vibrio quintilis]
MLYHLFTDHTMHCRRHFRTVAMWLLTLPGLSGCYLNINIGDSDDDDTQQPSQAAYWTPAPGTSWHIQLQNLDQISIDADVQIYEVDLFDGAQGSNSVINQLKQQNKQVVCYFSAGTKEDWRDDAAQLTDEALIPDGELQDWPGETWLNISDQTILEQVIQPVMEARLDLASDAGCDGVDPDNVDAYTNTDETHGLISYADQLAYNIWLAQEAHKRDLSVGLKNDLNQLDTLVTHFDFAVNEQCFAYNECSVYENTFLSAGKAVFNLEYYQDGSEGEISSTEFLNSACPYFRQAGITGVWKQGVALDGKNILTCQ